MRLFQLTNKIIFVPMVKSHFVACDVFVLSNPRIKKVKLFFSNITSGFKTIDRPTVYVFAS